MDANRLIETARAMVAPGKGILAMDESHGTCEKRFKAVGVECTEVTRRDYRAMLLTAEGLGEYISGAILFDETLRQSTADGKRFVDVMEQAGIIPGIKVDTGAKPLALHDGETVTEGLDGLRDRLAEYSELGARFAKWRAVIRIGDGMPSSACIEANCHALARYAALCQEASIVPIVEPEVLMDGEHDLEECFEITEAVLRTLFSALYEHSVMIEGTILKASMVISGANAKQRASAEEVAQETLRCLKYAVPAALPGVVFLSGGQSEEDASTHLDLMNKLDEPKPWPLSFSYGRGLQASALKLWAKDRGNIAAAQAKLLERAKANSQAALGKL
jgi:fructose-bisphosphate aldolase class I